MSIKYETMINGKKKSMVFGFSGDEKDMGYIYSPQTYEWFQVNLKPSDGNLHVLTMVAYDNFFSGSVEEAKITGDALEALFEAMQEDGYRIMDAQHVMLSNDEYPNYKVIIFYK